MIARLLRSVDFERVLRTRSRVSGTHFALHHVFERPHQALRTNKALGAELSTGGAPHEVRPVDDWPSTPPECPWLGMVVPKRHARRSVTRSLLKRQIRAVASRFEDRLPPGLWVVRLRAPFDKACFVSAASDGLRVLARTELEDLFDGAVRRSTPGS